MGSEIFKLVSLRTESCLKDTIEKRDTCLIFKCSNRETSLKDQERIYTDIPNNYP